MYETAATPYPSWADSYLLRLSTTGLETEAAKSVGMTARGIRKLCEDNQEFAYAVEAALEEAADVLERTARDRALNGTQKGVYYQGTLMATETEHHDTVLLSFLKAKRRREFGDKQEVSGPGGKPLTVNIRSFTQPLDDQSSAALLETISIASFQTADDLC